MMNHRPGWLRRTRGAAPPCLMRGSKAAALLQSAALRHEWRTASGTLLGLSLIATRPSSRAVGLLGLASVNSVILLGLASAANSVILLRLAVPMAGAVFHDLQCDQHVVHVQVQLQG